MCHLGVIMLYSDLLALRPETRSCGEGQNPAEICFKHCRYASRQVRILDQIRPLEMESNIWMTTYFCYWLLFTLVPLLDTYRESHDLFVQACEYMYRYMGSTPLVVIMLSGAKALSQQLRVELPHPALDYLNAARRTLQPGQSEDIPVSWTIPSLVEPELEDPATELGNIILKWNSMTIECRST